MGTILAPIYIHHILLRLEEKAHAPSFVSCIGYRCAWLHSIFQARSRSVTRGKRHRAGHYRNSRTLNLAASNSELEGRRPEPDHGGAEKDKLVCISRGRWSLGRFARLLFKPADDFVLSAKLTVGYHSTWDAGDLVIYVNDSVWAKFGIKVTSEKKPTIVSVVTRTVSDDNNSIVVNGASAYLKIAKAGSGIFFYESQDGQNWTIIRGFTLGTNSDLRVGFSAQSPVGEGCQAEFSNIQYQPRRVNLWTGE